MVLSEEKRGARPRHIPTAAGDHLAARRLRRGAHSGVTEPVPVIPPERAIEVPVIRFFLFFSGILSEAPLTPQAPPQRSRVVRSHLNDVITLVETMSKP